MLSTLIIIIAIVWVAPTRSSSTFVWTGYYNTTGMDNVGYVCLIGLLTTLYGMSGYEAASQVSEETQNAQVSAPWGIVQGVIAAIVTGLAFFIGLLYAMDENYDSALNGVSNQPVINIFSMAFNNSFAGAMAMSVMLAINVYLGGFSHMTVTTRVVFAMSRDGAFPGSSYITGVSGKSKLPLKSIIFVFIVDSCIVLLPLISSTAFSAITQISTIGYSISYAIPIILRVTVSRNTFQQGPYNLGRWSQLNGSIAAIFLVCTSICFFLPTSFDANMHQTVQGFNWTIVVWTGALMIAGTYWFLPKSLGGARHFFKGPVRPEDVVQDIGGQEKKFIRQAQKPAKSVIAVDAIAVEDIPAEFDESNLHSPDTLVKKRVILNESGPGVSKFNMEEDQPFELRDVKPAER